MILLLRSSRRVSTLSKKLIIMLVAFSSGITLVITAVQLFLDYQVQRDQVERLMERMEILFPPLAAEVWSFDSKQLQLSLDSLAQLPDIERISVTALDDGSKWSAQSGLSQRQIVRSYPLFYKVRGEDRQIATIEIAAGLDKVYGTLMWQGVTILLGNGFKTLLVVIFLYGVFRHLVTVRIEELARRVEGLVPQFTNDQVSTPADVPGPAVGDEIDAVRWAFDDMAKRLRQMVEELNASNRQLVAENLERRRAELELREMVDKLSKAMVELERFAYVAAHDLKEPIRSIVSFSQLLDRRYADQLGDEGRQFLGFVIDAARRMSNLVTDLLDYSRCDKKVMGIAPVDCNQILADALKGLEVMIRQKGAEVVVGHLPRLNADVGQLLQLFMNLLTNSLKFSRPEVAPRVEISAERKEDGWLFSVADNGIGIDPSYGDYVFEVFRRLHTSDAYPGTGIGLAICKRVVENHGGRIWLASSTGEGTTFQFLLPESGIGRDDADRLPPAPTC